MLNARDALRIAKTARIIELPELVKAKLSKTIEQASLDGNTTCLITYIVNIHQERVCQYLIQNGYKAWVDGSHFNYIKVSWGEEE